ncbi:archaetidylinositol phosphate synthase [Halalkalicoccus paucihalophilus]|uniref:Archaetidylinositol phosphate synthase n=1 Tax=Halalkalicoccus paucihalophilus TaxID=1008153 RepID=A0A151ACS1_9EURY|nr:CDP-alcohol phosphatidyltransferase family protein [Halalkalicoccus paucihalophilus]KYH25340.1 archaetidylinositol phosphate synthase [Halalkalicoccus paucihalophilus]
MTLDKYRPLADRALEPFVEGADRVGLSPNGVSVLAFALAGVAAGAFYLGGTSPGWYLVGALLVLLNGALDLLDGALARRQNVASTAGDLLDHVLDRYADILIIAGLAAGIGEYALGFVAVTGVLMTSYLGTQAQAVGLDRVYGGMLGRADRLVLVGVVAILTGIVPVTIGWFTLVGWLLVLFAVVGHITALQRFYYSMGALG